MRPLLTKKDAAEYLRFSTVDSAEKFLESLGVPKLNKGLAGSKGILYRRSDIDIALEKIEVGTKSTTKKSVKKRQQVDVFDLPPSEGADLILTKNTPTQ